MPLTDCEDDSSSSMKDERTGKSIVDTQQQPSSPQQQKDDHSDNNNYNNNNNNNSMLNTTMSCDEDGSVIVEYRNSTSDTSPKSNRTIAPDRTKTTTIEHTTVVYPTPKRTRNQRWIGVVLGMAILLCFGSGLYFFLHSKIEQHTVTNERSKNESPITFEEFALHTDIDTNCWILLLDNRIYDVTDYAPTHPGGSEYVTDFCGSNATKDFLINHPVEYLNIYLSSNSERGVLVTSLPPPEPVGNTTTTTDDPSTSDNNNNNNNNDVGDEDTTPTTTKAPAPISAPTVGRPTAPVDVPIDNTDDNNSDDETNLPTSSPISACISLNEVALHSTVDDCFYILYDYVYDFTFYIDEHPGGRRNVFQQCGTDATIIYSNEEEHTEELLLEINAIDLYGLGYAC